MVEHGQTSQCRFLRVARVSAVEANHVTARVVAGSILRDSPATTMSRTVEGLREICLKRFRGYFLCFSEICLLEEEVCEQSDFWSVGDVLESRICSNAFDISANIGSRVSGIISIKNGSFCGRLSVDAVVTLVAGAM